MQASTIAKLAWYKPRGRERTPSGLRSPSTPGLKDVPDWQAADMWHYMECYKNLKFGWEFATDMAKDPSAQFPAFLRGDDLYLWRAYQFVLGRHDSVVAGALLLASNQMRSTRQQVESLLVHESITPRFIASRLGISLDVVKAYEKLFFNVIDRRREHSFIASIVYPDGRAVEAYENYLETTGLGTLMMRAGYNYGPDYVLYCAGIGRNPFEMLTAAEGATRMDALIMANGMMLSSLGWLNQSRNAIGIQHARQSIQAAKLGGGGEGGLGDLPSLGDSLKDALTEMGRRRSSAVSLDGIIDVTPEN